jgi:hypothetical protein
MEDRFFQCSAVIRNPVIGHRSLVVSHPLSVKRPRQIYACFQVRTSPSLTFVNLVKQLLI